MTQLQHGYPTDEASALLCDVLDAQRTAEANLWGLPIVGFATWRAEQARVYAAGAFDDFVVLDSLREKRGIVTANPTTPYIVGWVDLADGPVVIDYPAGVTSGGVLDFWRRPRSSRRCGCRVPDGRRALGGSSRGSTATGAQPRLAG